MKQTKHEFAFFLEQLPLLKKGQYFTIQDKDIVHRLGAIVRVELGDTIVLFTQQEQMRCTILQVTKKEITMRCEQRLANTLLTPEITWLLPLLERDAFESSLYALAAMGATTIVPVITTKSRQKWGSEKELERAQRIMIAAAEQSKQFCLPNITPAISFEALSVKDGISLFFDAQGDAAWNVLQTVRARITHKSSLTCCVGPEGDLTEAEKETLRDAGFIFCALTPTILKASAAVEVGMGLLRSCL